MYIDFVGMLYGILFLVGCVLAIPIGVVLFDGVDEFIGRIRNRDVIEKLEKENKKLKEDIKELQSMIKKGKKIKK